MNHRATVGIVLLVAVACAGAASYWFQRQNHIREAAPILNSISPSKATADSFKPDRDLNVVPTASLEEKKPERTSNAGFPLRDGESLEFSANVAKLNNVAILRLLVAERRNFLGKSAWHLQAFAHTENPLRMVFDLDDQFDSYSDVRSLTSLQYEMHLNERGQKVNSIQRMSSTGRDPAPADAAAVRVLPGTRDPLGMMQYLRNVDWAKTPEVRSSVYDGHKLYDVRAKRMGSTEAVAVPAGRYVASKIELTVFDNGVEMKDAHFSLYLANNEAKLPVLLEAVMPFANARVELVRVK